MGKSCERGAASAKDCVGSGTRKRKSDAGPRRKVEEGMAKPGSLRIASRAECRNRLQIEKPEEERGRTLGNSLSCSSKRTSWKPREDDPSSQSPPQETSKLTIASTSGSWKLSSPWQPPPPGRIRGAEGTLPASPSHRLASYACADVGVAGRAAVVGPNPGWTWWICFWAFLPRDQAGAATVSSLPRSLRCPRSGRAPRTGHDLGRSLWNSTEVSVPAQ